jgi:hypothetical protein
VDSHRSFSPDEPDGQWYQQERGYPDPDWERRGADPRYAPQQPPEVAYGQAPGYHEQGYGDYQVPEPRGGYEPEPESRYTALTDPGDIGQTGRMAPVGRRSGEPMPPMPAAPQLPPQLTTPDQPVSAPAYSAPTSGLPHLGADGRPQLGADSPSLLGSDGAPPWSGDGEPVRHATEQLDRAALRRPAGGPGQLGDGVYRSRRPGTAAALIAVTAVLELVALRLLVAAFFGHPVQVGGSIASAFLALGVPMFGLGLYGLLGGAAATPGAGGRAWLRAPLVYLPIALTLFVAAGLAV